MNDMDELGRLSAMFRLLPVIFTSSDHTLAGKPMSIERDVRRYAAICAYVMAHYIHTISLDDIADRSRHEPLCFLFLLQTLQRNDLLAVCNPISLKYSLRTS